MNGPLGPPLLESWRPFDLSRGYQIGLRRYLAAPLLTKPKQAHHLKNPPLTPGPHQHLDMIRADSAPFSFEILYQLIQALFKLAFSRCLARENVRAVLGD
jgi:hypothetical protein